MYKTFQLKIKNSNSDYFNQLFREGKYFYNTILTSENIFKFDTKINTVYKTPEISTELEFLSSQMKQEIKDQITDSIKNLAVKKARGFKIGKLKFKKFINCIPLKNQTFKFIGNKIKLQGNRKSKFKVSGLDQLPENYKIKSGKLLRNATGIYLHVIIETENNVNLENKPEKPVLGVDFGIKDSLTFSDGTIINTSFKELENQIKHTGKQLSSKIKGSKNRGKARKILAKKYQKLNNQKRDTSNKILNKLKSFSICFQDEMISNWQKGWFRKQVQKGILGRIKDGLCSNPENLMISRSLPTTKFCPNCAVLNEISLNQRIYTCICGYTKLRDIHSAQNMILFGTGRSSVEKEATVFNLLMEIKCKFLSVKQEAN